MGSACSSGAKAPTESAKPISSPPESLGEAKEAHSALVAKLALNQVLPFQVSTCQSVMVYSAKERMPCKAHGVSASSVWRQCWHGNQACVAWPCIPDVHTPHAKHYTEGVRSVKGLASA